MWKLRPYGVSRDEFRKRNNVEFSRHPVNVFFYPTGREWHLSWENEHDCWKLSQGELTFNVEDTATPMDFYKICEFIEMMYTVGAIE